MRTPSISTPITRRTALKGAAGAVALAAAPAALAACSSSGGGTSAGTTSAATAGATGAAANSGSGGSVTFGSNYSQAAQKATFLSLVSEAEKATDVSIKVNTVDHNTFQNNITSYLQGTPNDLFTWFAGYRMQTFASKGLIEQIDDVWDKIGPNFNNAAKTLSKGQDGHYYFVPIYNYAWVVFYNKSTFAKNGYEIPKTWDAMVALCKQMKKDGLIPFAFGQKGGWPALGTFDILDLRINGYDYHMKLCRQDGAAWTDPEVTAVFDQWAEIMPYFQPGGVGRPWPQAAQTLEKKKAGMMFQGANQVAAQYAADKVPIADLDFFVYPEINPKWGQDFMDAPADGFCIAKKAKSSDIAAAKKVIEYIGSPEGEAAWLKTDQWDVGLATNAHITTYNAIQKKEAQVIGACKQVAQFLDRDSDGGFADNTVAHAIDQFIQDPTPGTIKSIQKNLAAQAKTVFAS